MRRIVVDTNLLLLLIVGLSDLSLIGKHKRTMVFESEDFVQLRKLLVDFDTIMVTPHVLTEVSNLLSQIREPACGQLRSKFAEIVVTFVESFEPSKDVVMHRAFLRLGLTDCALLNLVGESIPILTTDLDLYLAAIERKPNAVNFNHLRQNWLLCE